MSALEVPEEAVTAAARALFGADASRRLPYCRRKALAVLEAAAPLIVAAELDAWIRELETLGLGKQSVHVGHLMRDFGRWARVLRGEGDQ